MSFQTEINLFVIESKIFSIIHKYAIRYSIYLHRALTHTQTHVDCKSSIERMLLYADAAAAHAFKYSPEIETPFIFM